MQFKHKTDISGVAKYGLKYCLQYCLCNEMHSPPEFIPFFHSWQEGYSPTCVKSIQKRLDAMNQHLRILSHKVGDRKINLILSL